MRFSKEKPSIFKQPKTPRMDKISVRNSKVTID